MAAEGSHALSLKVMRLSRPSLATSTQPFFSHHPSLTEHAAASVLSLEDSKHSSSSHPTTLRDFSLSEVMTLSATFGSIQLGETFSGIITINNDSYHPGIDVSSVNLKVEMQTSAAKVIIGGPSTASGDEDISLRPAAFMETVVHHEIKELGQHVLACTLSYRIPPALTSSYPVPPDDPSDPTLRFLRKYYKFMVTNPLSVKTKIQATKSPNALLKASEREKVFLEVHIQNLTQKPMTFQRVRFECVDGWIVQDVNDGIYVGRASTVAAQEVRQYLYVLTPHLATSRKIVTPPTPGSIVPLGRLDISWTTTFGEPGRLLTSLLSRRVPVDGPPPTALPAHVQPQNRPASVRPQSPVVTSRPSSPAPFKVKGTQLSRPQSPMTVVGPAAPVQVNRPPIAASLLIRYLPTREEIHVRVPFRVGYTLTLATDLDWEVLEALGITLQFLEVRKAETLATREGTTLGEAGTPMGSPSGTPVRGSFNWNELVGSPIAASPEIEPRGYPGSGYPVPYLDRSGLEGSVDGCAEHIGASILPLPPSWTTRGRTEHSFDFDGDFIGVTKGLLQIGGGLRVLDCQHGTLAEWPLIGQIVVN